MMVGGPHVRTAVLGISLTAGLAFAGASAPVVAQSDSAPSSAFTLSGGLRTEVVVDDNGLEVASGQSTRPAATSVSLSTLYLDLRAMSRGSVTAKVRLRFAERGHMLAEPEIATALGIWQTPWIITVVGGRGQVEAGGFELAVAPEERIAPSPYWADARISAFPEVVDQIALHFDLGEAGGIRLQLLDDPLAGALTTSPRSYNRSHLQPAAIVAYQGREGAVVPLVQAGTYDLNHSKFIVGALRFSIAALGVDVSHTYDMRDVAGPGEAATVHISNTMASARYTFRNAMEPFVTVSRFAVREDGSEVTGNGRQTPEDTEGTLLATASPLRSDNGRDGAIGLWFDTPVRGLRPLIVYQYRDGEYLVDSAQPSGPTVRRDQRIIQTGLRYRF